MWESFAFLLLGLCKAGRTPFSRSNLKGATSFVQGGYHFDLESGKTPQILKPI